MKLSTVFFTCLRLLFVLRGAMTSTGTLRSSGATATQSTNFHDWYAARAIDGNPSTTSASCGCCAATVEQYQPWLRIDLHRLYRLGTVEVIGRTDNYDVFTGMGVYLHKQTWNWQRAHVRKVTIPQVVKKYYMFKFDEPVIAQYVTLQLPGSSDLLCICEVNIYSEDCSPGTYGAKCNDSCGSCQNGEPCDHVTGTCRFCEPGYIGNTCKDICTAGTFGQNCNSPCHCHDNQTCNRVTGTCPNDKCDLGWHGSNCSLECQPGTYGQNCLQDCGNCFGNEACNRRTGGCSFCSSGYRGLQCKEECSSKTFGQNCSSTCGNCKEPCDVVTGVCSTDCLPGYTGTYCNETCNEGFYGNNCSLPCGECATNVTCNYTNGWCEDGCEEGYVGQLCTKDFQNSAQSGQSSGTAIGIAAGCSIAVICVVAVLVFVFIIRRRRNLSGRENKNHDHGNTNTLDGGQNMTTLSQEGNKNGTAIRGYVYGKDDLSNTYKNVIKKGDEIEANSTGGDDWETATSATEYEQSDADCDISEYYSFEPKKIQVCNLWDYIESESQRNNETLIHEFELLKKCPTQEAKVGLDEVNAAKNRYRGFFAYDHSRVIIQRKKSGESDYINANYILGYENEKKFIASQGPTTAMVNEFLLMVFQQKCEIIVMLTNVYELGVRKCLQYWPQQGDISFGDVTVTFLNEEVYTDYVIRHLELKTIDGSSQSVSQYHFKAWPDKDIPDNAWCLVNFLRAVDSMATNVTTPIVVHCSAGIGRTGTFIALDNMFHQAKATGAVSPFEVVRKLREQRIKMVQTQAQYIYLHEAAAETRLFGTRAIESTRFDELYAFMNTPDRTGRSRYNRQLKLIKDSMKDMPVFPQSDIEYSNVDFSIDADGKLLVRTGDGSTSNTVLDSSFIPMVIGLQTCILARSPGPADVEMFWNLINQLRIRTVIMATNSAHPHYQTCCNLGISEPTAFGHLKISQTPDEDKVAGQSTFAVLNSKKDQLLTVKQFQIPTCSEGSDTPRDSRAVADTLSSVQTWRAQTPPTDPILIHCGDGERTSGLVAVVLNEVLRMKHHNGAINIVASVKKMKQVHNDIITSAEQLKFCYDTIYAFLHLDDIYQN